MTQPIESNRARVDRRQAPSGPTLGLTYATIEALVDVVRTEWPIVPTGMIDEGCFFCGGMRSWGAADDPLRTHHEETCAWVLARQDLGLPLT